ncbi:hypothetical protein GQ53DRAFT_865868 [Thozetella sp. PMI_491]|nr:hypothetical protein GQ53DRAFT_865868 [Thozetella sp. PMI_491]
MSNRTSVAEYDLAWAAEDKGPAVVAVLCTFTPLAAMFCAMRIYSRGYLMGKMQLDDYFIIFSVICGLISMSFSVKAVMSGDGRHFDVLTYEQKGEALLWSIVSFTPSVLSFAVPKLGVAALLDRLLSPSRLQRAILWSLVILCNITLNLCNIFMFAQCSPSRALWDLSITDKKCWEPSTVVKWSFYAGTLSAFTDLYLALYPAVVLFGLQMKLKKKLILSAALGVGSVATVISVYKITRMPSLASTDFTYDTCDLTIWTCIEGSTLIIAACIPVLGPFYEKVFGRGFLGGSSKRYKNFSASDISNEGHQHNNLDAPTRNRNIKDPNGLSFLDDTIRTTCEGEIGVLQMADIKDVELGCTGPAIYVPAQDWRK